VRLVQGIFDRKRETLNIQISPLTIFPASTRSVKSYACEACLLDKEGWYVAKGKSARGVV
jgi:hypothetical protein